MGKRLNYVGKSFGRWTVLSEAGKSAAGRVLLLCRCSCGVEKNVQACNLVYGISKSCGCLKKDCAEKRNYNRKPSGMSGSRSLLANYKSHAKSRNLIFDISFDDFIRITSSCCYYCGAPPHREHKLKHAAGPKAGMLRVNGAYVYNGIDRVDPQMGYVLSNVVTSCFHCNHAKNNHSQKDFLSWVKRIYEFQFKKGF